LRSLTVFFLFSSWNQLLDTLAFRTPQLKPS
jgi:hypothetical protein